MAYVTKAIASDADPRDTRLLFPVNKLILLYTMCVYKQ